MVERYLLCVHLQELHLQFGQAVWTAKQSHSGFSVSFFWRSNSRVADGAPLAHKKKNKKPRRYKKKSPAPSINLSEDAASSKPLKQPRQVSPIIAHHQDQTPKPPSSSEDELDEDLLLCDKVSFALKEGVPGLKYKNNDDEEGWVEVKRRKSKKCQSLGGLERDENCDDGLNDITSAREVRYQERDKVPGLYIRKGCTMSSVTWTPVKPSPISSRLRHRPRRK